MQKQSGSSSKPKSKKKQNQKSKHSKNVYCKKLTLKHLSTIVEGQLGERLDTVGRTLEAQRLKWMKGHVREFLGTQQPIFTLKTGITTLTTSGTNLTQVVAMDVTGVTAWSSLANLFDEYRVRKAVLHIMPLYQSYGASATTIAALPIIVVVDYDDATAIASSTNAQQYDTYKLLYLGSASCKTLKSKTAYPEGQPDLAWVTTASPTVPFWWKFWSVTSLVPSSAQVGYAYIEAEIEFRQVA